MYLKKWYTDDTNAGNTDSSGFENSFGFLISSFSFLIQIRKNPRPEIRLIRVQSLFQ